MLTRSAGGKAVSALIVQRLLVERPKTVEGDNAVRSDTAFLER